MRRAEAEARSKACRLMWLDTYAFADIADELDARLAQRPDDRQQIEQLRADLSELKAAIETKRKSRWGTIGEAAKVLRETYDWAAPLLKTLFAVIIPGLSL